MQYVSTRGKMEPIGFQETVLSGLAPDGGLIVPKEIPSVENELDNWANLSYQDLAFEIMRIYTDIPEPDLKEIILDGYRDFDHDEIAPVTKHGELFIQELYHGPTLAFKDIALQLLGNIFSYILEKEDRNLNILAATSGDTGSAAIQGVHGRSNINIFVMHPNNRISPTQELQMTTVLDENVFNLGIEGSFDDCQEIMKSLFSDMEFKSRYSLGSVNSVNWARVLAQIVYFFYSYFRVKEQTGSSKVQFSVPTGNFGDILAGYYAWRMGLPVERLILATNENNILSRFFRSGYYTIGPVVSTLSPSMDIQVASNFERYLYYLLDEDSAELTEVMENFKKTGEIAVPCHAPQGVDEIFYAGEANGEETLEAIRDMNAKHDYIPDPHTAVGIHVARQLGKTETPLVCMGTAHPAKFDDAIKQAIGKTVSHPALDRLRELPTVKEELPADIKAVRNFIADNCSF